MKSKDALLWLSANNATLVFRRGVHGIIVSCEWDEENKKHQLASVIAGIEFDSAIFDQWQFVNAMVGKCARHKTIEWNKEGS